MQDKFLELRDKYPVFYYHNYMIEEGDTQIIIKFNFEIKGLTSFEPKWTIEKGDNFNFDKSDPIINNIIFNIGMVEVISYLKATCSPKLIVECGLLDRWQIDFYKKLYFNGLGELLYRNGITTSMDELFEIECTSNIVYSSKNISDLSGNLILVGGGKDSLVSLKLLDKYKNDNKCYILNPRESWIEGVRQSNYDISDVFSMKRAIDTKLIELNKQGYLNGHTPLSALLAMSSLLPAYLLRKKNICVSNESSANESTVKNTKINHQYSKSFEFETDFRNYCNSYISKDFNYYSLLRPLSEYQIAKYFSKLTNLHHVFHSCNLGSKIDVWCNECPKCLFIFLLFSPFLTQDELSSIFGVNMLEDIKNIEEFEKLIGVTDVKSFECVGSRAEVNFAIKKAINNMADDELPLLLEIYKERYFDIDDNMTDFDKYFDSNNYVPSELLEIIKNEVINSDNR